MPKPFVRKYVPRKIAVLKPILFRRLHPIPEWDTLSARIKDGIESSSTIVWELSILKEDKVVCKLPYTVDSIHNLIMEAEALGCNIADYRHLMLDEPIYSNPSDLLPTPD